MAAITTTGTSQDPLTTTYASPETTREWVGRHNGAVNNAHVNGNKLTTTWPTSGGTATVVTDRQSGESDSDFLQRHISEYLTEMVGDPPVH